jgi:2-polyprenyl-3-methyl-5-hydroxy-6-metoxy-1,4-benzoquinol methylase
MRSAMILREMTATGLHAWLLPRVQALPGISNDSRVLDLGCGTGAWLQRLHGAGFKRLTGMDQRRDYFGASDAASFVQGDIAQGNRIELGSFDLITALEVFEHMANPQAIFAFASQHLGAGGQLVVTTPNIYSVRVRMRFLLTGKLTWFEHNAEPEHIHPLVLDAVKRQILPEYGLGIDRVLTYPEHGSDGTRWFLRIAERALSLVVSNNLPGDSLCLFLRKQQ